MADDALIPIADELYALPPTEFTAARNSRAATVKADDRDLAERVRELKKPSPGAWLVNQLVRHRASALAAVLDLGDELRDAQERRDAPELTRLTRLRRTEVAALGRTAGELAAELGHPVARAGLDEVEQTVNAALADAAATDAVLSGRLVRTLITVGFDPVDLDNAVAGGAAVPRPAGRPVEDIAVRRERKRLEQAASEAERAAASARRAFDIAAGHAADAERRRREAQADRDDAEDRLRAADARLARADRESAELERERDAAQSASAEAETAAAAAREALDD
ncbi:MAG: transposase [Leifsonia sp.]